VDTSMPFEKLRERARITEVAKGAEEAGDFSERIRAGQRE